MFQSILHPYNHPSCKEKKWKISPRLENKIQQEKEEWGQGSVLVGERAGLGGETCLPGKSFPGPTWDAFSGPNTHILQWESRALDPPLPKASVIFFFSFFFFFVYSTVSFPMSLEKKMYSDMCAVLNCIFPDPTPHLCWPPLCSLTL